MSLANRIEYHEVACLSVTDSQSRPESLAPKRRESFCLRCCQSSPPGREFGPFDQTISSRPSGEITCCCSMPVVFTSADRFTASFQLMQLHPTQSTKCLRYFHQNDVNGNTTRCHHVTATVPVRHWGIDSRSRVRQLRPRVRQSFSAADPDI